MEGFALFTVENFNLPCLDLFRALVYQTTCYALWLAKKNIYIPIITKLFGSRQLELTLWRGFLFEKTKCKHKVIYSKYL